MQVNKTDKRLLCEDYCKIHTEIKDYTLAKKIYEENKDKFTSVENARDHIRKIRGHHGKKLREQTSDKSQYKPITYDTTNQKPLDKINTGARILILDIETAPINAYVWSAWKQNINPQQIITDWFILTWAAKWLFEDKVYSASVTPKEAVRQDDKRIMQSLWQLLNDADIVIAHNGQDFDIPKINSRFLLHGFMPPLPYQVIDTLKHIRKQFGFTHNKLDYVNQLLNLPRKVGHDGFEMWDQCYRGNKESLNKMLEYNIGDVRILEDTYLRIRPWIKPHPSTSLHILDEHQHRCPSCGSADLQVQGSGYFTSVNIYETLRCGNCGGVSRKRKTAVPIKQRQFITQSVAR
jgi:DNA polymerase elongation subunit (family B)